LLASLSFDDIAAIFRASYTNSNQYLFGMAAFWKVAASNKPAVPALSKEQRIST
jgi:hypothetical protein